MTKEQLQKLCDHWVNSMAAVRHFFANNTGWFVAALVLITIFRICIGTERGLQEAFFPHDDYLYLQLAHNIAKGKWLGVFNSLTMAKSCIFPCYIALSILSGLPYLLLVDLSICAVAFLGMVAFRPKMNRFWSLLFYTGLIFNPAYFFYQRLVIQDLFSTMILGMVFCLSACWIRRDSSLKKYWIWLVGSNLFFVFIVHTREEGMVFLSLPVAVCMLLFFNMLYRKYARREIIIHVVSFILIPVVLYYCVNLTIRALNKEYYGIAETCIRHNRAYKGFIGSLLGAAKQLDPAWDIRIPLRRKVLVHLYELSPTLKQLKPYLDKSWWHNVATDRFPAEVLKNEPDLIINTKGGFIQWELLDAMSAAGYFKKGNWKETRQFMENVVQEFQQAEKEGKLPGFKPRYSNLPPYSKQMVKWFFTKFSWDAKYLFTWGGKLFSKPQLYLKNTNIPEVQLYYASLKSNSFFACDCYKVIGWGYIPSEKKQIDAHNFQKSQVFSFRQENRPDVQSFLTKHGYPNIPPTAGFSFYLRGCNLIINDGHGKIIFSGDVQQKNAPNGIFLDKVTKVRMVSVIKWKRIFTRQMCVLSQKYGWIISCLSGLLVIVGILYGFFHRSAWLKILDLFFSAFLIWGTGFLYFCLIILANTMLHCPRNAGYYFPASVLIYSACCIFIIGGLSVVFSNSKPADAAANL